MNPERKPRPVQFRITNFGKTRVFSFNGVPWNLTREQVIFTEDDEFAKFMSTQYMVSVTKKVSGLPI